MGNFIFTVLGLIVIAAVILFFCTVVIPAYPELVLHFRAIGIRKGQIYYRGFIPDDPFSDPGPKHLVKVLEVKRGRNRSGKYVKYQDLENNQIYSDKAIVFIDERHKIKKTK